MICRSQHEGVVMTFKQEEKQVLMPMLRRPALTGSAWYQHMKQKCMPASSHASPSASPSASPQATPQATHHATTKDRSLVLKRAVWWRNLIAANKHKSGEN